MDKRYRMIVMPDRIAFNLRLIIPGTTESEVIQNEILSDFLQANSLAMPKKHSDLRILDKVIVLINNDIAGIASIIKQIEPTEYKPNDVEIKIYIKDSEKARDFVKNVINASVSHPYIGSDHVLILLSDCEISLTKNTQYTNSVAAIRDIAC